MAEINSVISRRLSDISEDVRAMSCKTFRDYDIEIVLKYVEKATLQNLAERCKDVSVCISTG